MPQPKSSSGSKKAPTKAGQAAVAADPTGVLEVLAKGVVLTADRIHDAMDDAVRRGRMTRDDAEDLARLLIETGRKQTEELLAGLRREGDRARRAAGLGAFPISRYDELTAAQIATRLGDLSPAQLRKVRDYERRHGNRKAVLGPVEKRLG